MIRERLEALSRVEAQIAMASAVERPALEAQRDALLSSLADLAPQDKVRLARHPHRPRIGAYIEALFTDFFEQRGDRLGYEDTSVLGGIARFHGRPVTVIGHRKGQDISESIACNFGMPGPEGYRKALRMMRQAEKFGRPIITFIDTPGAYPGVEAETRGQGEAIARNLAEMSRLSVPVIAVVTGEASSGGALAIGVANRVLMLENAIYAVLSPEGFASILWKDASRRDEAAGLMKITAQDLLGFGVIEEIVPEPTGGAQRAPEAVFAALDAALARHLGELNELSGEELARQRIQKYRRIGQAG